MALVITTLTTLHQTFWWRLWHIHKDVWLLWSFKWLLRIIRSKHV